jgi:polyisoprenoid-binding protein YceI
MRVALAIALVLTPLAPLSAETLALALDSPPVRLTVLKTGLMSGKKHVFEFPSYRAQLDYDPARPAGSRIDFVIDAARFDLKDDWVSAKDARKIADHARDKMLDAARHPEIRFRSREIVERSPGDYLVRGELSLRGQARPVEAVVRRVESAGALEFHGTAAVDMRPVGLDPPKAALGTIGTNPVMQVEFRLRTARPRPD